MRRIVRLYPRWWRDRYGGELEALLAEHPPTWRDSADLLRGALDARLHRRFPPPCPTAHARGGWLMKPLACILVLVLALAVGVTARSHLVATRTSSPTPPAQLAVVTDAGGLGRSPLVSICSPGSHPLILPLTVVLRTGRGVLRIPAGTHLSRTRGFIADIHGRTMELRFCSVQ